MLHDDLGWSLGVVFRTYIRMADTLMDTVPGGPRGYQVLTAATQEEPVGQGALAQRLGIDRTVMTYLVDELEKAGLVERRADTKDRRNKQIVATEYGEGLLTDLRHRLGKAEDHVLEPLSEAEGTRFRRLLRKLAVRAQDLDPVADACALLEELDAPRRKPPARP
jgi:MarR family transcriptional regulator for hemolysin